MKILAVDDDSVCRLVISGYLNRLGFSCDIANSGFEAINAFDKTCYDIMFIDYMMPDMNGIDASKIILSKHNPKIVLVTANYEASSLIEAAKIKYLLFKPIKLCDVHNLMPYLL